MKLDLSRGAIVTAHGRRYQITDNALGFDRVEARDAETGVLERLAVADIHDPAEDVVLPVVPDLSELDTEDIEEARRRVSVIRPLLELPRRRAADIREAMARLHVGKTTLYRWMNKFAIDGRLTSLKPTIRPGGRGKSRLHPDVERIIESAIQEHHLKALQPPVRSTVREVRRRCKNVGLEPPHENTIRARIAAIPEKTALRRRGQSKRADDRLTPRPDHYEEATQPLGVVQIDHTRLDIVLVDERFRLPLRRPFLTLALDVYSRMVVGFYVSFDTPGALGTGLCIARSILPKEGWLKSLGIEIEWPCWGFPTKIHVDNAQEFRGEMLRLACEQYGIAIDFRPVANPSTGGHVERVLGTIAKHIHEVAGAARKPHERGDYDPEANAIMTLPELEERLAAYITGIYHQQLHSAINTTPLKRWSDAILGDGKRPGLGLFPKPNDEERLRIDFMPVVKRTIQPYGVQIDGILYYSDVLRSQLRASKRDRRQHIFHRDPRDISAIYFWDRDQQQYFAIPYRNAMHPPISIWELRVVQKHLAEQGRADVDERVIFETYERLRAQEERADILTRQARRNTERRSALKREVEDRKVGNGAPIRTNGIPSGSEPKRFDRIEPLETEEDL